MMHAQINTTSIHTYLALGDSYTIGESVAEEDRFPIQLVRRLNEAGYSISNPKIIAKTGWTTDELMAAIVKEHIEDQTFDMVSLLIGVNNQYRGRDVEVYRREFTELVSRAVKFARNNVKNVFVVSIPDWGMTPFGKKSPKQNISQNINLFNKVNKEVCIKMGILYIDITPDSRLADKDPDLIANDGLHPSAKMYANWVDHIIRELPKK
jgi:lysophospholipase L1-like esterase